MGPAIRLWLSGNLFSRLKGFVQQFQSSIESPEDTFAFLTIGSHIFKLSCSADSYAQKQTEYIYFWPQPVNEKAQGRDSILLTAWRVSSIWKRKYICVWWCRTSISNWLVITPGKHRGECHIYLDELLLNMRWSFSLIAPRSIPPANYLFSNLTTCSSPVFQAPTVIDTWISALCFWGCTGFQEKKSLSLHITTNPLIPHGDGWPIVCWCGMMFDWHTAPNCQPLETCSLSIRVLHIRQTRRLHLLPPWHPNRFLTISRRGRQWWASRWKLHSPKISLPWKASWWQNSFNFWWKEMEFFSFSPILRYKTMKIPVGTPTVVLAWQFYFAPFNCGK